ncbi:MAG: hypothetical protein BRD55_08160 [Bacteroidetes bacterium SW_9_63_38]|nr:MAG: hypothetical protein BRD55_08160 [Bacteroidetes bacterium SW_9_63_38]
MLNGGRRALFWSGSENWANERGQSRSRPIREIIGGGTEEIDEEDVAVRFGGNIQVRTGRHGNAIAGPQSALGLAGFLLTVTLIFHTNLAKQ